jgi:hypothetical protein
VNVGSRAPAKPLFYMALREGGPTATNGRRPRSGRVSDRDPATGSDPEIILGDHIPTPCTTTRVPSTSCSLCDAGILSNIRCLLCWFGISANTRGAEHITSDKGHTSQLINPMPFLPSRVFFSLTHHASATQPFAPS